jgi:curved DNA-binding protein CbpA
MQDFYEVLGVDKNADPVVIKAAFKRMAMRYHPDKNPGNREAEEMFKTINEAYHTLTDPVKRSRYDSRFHRIIADDYNDAYWQEIKRRRYYQWKQAQEKPYIFDKNYFKIQGLAFLVFLIIAGFCFGIINTAHYYVQQQELAKLEANSQLLNQVKGLFDAGKFDDAFVMIHGLQQKDPLEFRFAYARDSLVDALRVMADRKFAEQDFKGAIAHYLVLKNYEHPIRFETLDNMSMCQYYLGNYKESLQALKHLHNQQPYNLALIYQIGVINLEKVDNAEEALQYFTLGKKLFKENLGQVYGKAFQIVMNPADASDIYYYIFHARAMTNLKLKNYKDAATDCNWAIYLRPAMGEPYYLRATANIHNKDFTNVCDDLSKASLKGITQSYPLKKRYCE